MPKKRKRKPVEPDRPDGRGWRIAFLLLCTVGVCLSADLLRLHVNVHTNPDYHSYCAMSEWVNCDSVAASDYSVLLGLPLSVWGLVGYTAMGLLAVWGLRRHDRGPLWPFGLAFWLGLLFALAGVALYLVSHLAIEAVCIVCGGTYLVNLGLALTAWMAVRRAGSTPGRALSADLASLRAGPGPVLTFAVVLLACVAVLSVAIPSYWRVELPTGPGGLPVGVTEHGHPWIGAREPVLEIVEYSDYQCPHCQRGHEEVRKLIESRPDLVRLVHRQYPLDHHCNSMVNRPFHPYACDYAKLSWCAQQQGSFWEANDFLFKHGRRRGSVGVAELADALELDEDSLRNCLSSDEAKRVVQEDLEAGRALQIRGTPTFVVNGRTYPGRVPPEVIQEILGSELQ